MYSLLALPMLFHIFPVCWNYVCNWEAIIFYRALFQQPLGHLDGKPSDAQNSKCHHKLPQSPSFCSYTHMKWQQDSKVSLAHRVKSGELKNSFNTDLGMLTEVLILPSKVQGQAFDFFSIIRYSRSSPKGVVSLKKCRQFDFFSLHPFLRIFPLGLCRELAGLGKSQI